MDREVAVELARYRPIREYVPQIGDVVIKHGFLFAKTKWFGVVNNINEDRSLNVLKEGLPCLLFSTPPSILSKTAVVVDPSDLLSRGGYTIMQQDTKTNQVIWYV